MDWLIYWRNPESGEYEVDPFSTEVEAREALAGFMRDYPWNTYTLAQAVEIVEATQAWRPRYSMEPSK